MCAVCSHNSSSYTAASIIPYRQYSYRIVHESGLYSMQSNVVKIGCSDAAQQSSGEGLHEVLLTVGATADRIPGTQDRTRCRTSHARKFRNMTYVCIPPVPWHGSKASCSRVYTLRCPGTVNLVDFVILGYIPGYPLPPECIYTLLVIIGYIPGYPQRTYPIFHTRVFGVYTHRVLRGYSGTKPGCFIVLRRIPGYSQSIYPTTHNR